MLVPKVHVADTQHRLADLRERRKTALRGRDLLSFDRRRKRYLHKQQYVIMYVAFNLFIDCIATGWSISFSSHASMRSAICVVLVMIVQRHHRRKSKSPNNQ